MCGLLTKQHFAVLMAFCLIPMHCFIGKCMLKLVLILELFILEES